MNIIYIIVLINICTLIRVHYYTETLDEVFCELFGKPFIIYLYFFIDERSAINLFLFPEN